MLRNLTFSFLFIFFFAQFAVSQTKSPFQRMDVFDLEWASNPQISPNGNKVVYQRNSMDIMKDSRKSELWIIDTNGNNHMKLTEREVQESSPVWSPLGDRIAFVSATNEGSEIYIYWISTGKTARITQLDRSPRGLRWSPNGTQISFVKLVPSNEPTLVSALPKPKGAKWADAPKVITRLKHESDGSGYNEPGFSHLFVVPAEGGTARQITKGDFNHGTGQWTKDGRHLIFSSNLKEDWEYDFRNSEIYSVELLTGNIFTLTQRVGPDQDPAISPDGTQIAYTGYDDKVQTYQITRLYVMDLDGSNKKEIETKLDRSVGSLKWSSEGKGIYFQYDDKGTTKIGYTNLTGNTQVAALSLGGTSIGRPYGGGSYSISKKDKIAYTFCTVYHPADIAIVDKGSNNSLVISFLNRDLFDYRKLGKVEEIWYKSTFDQRDIQGWVIYPPDYEASRKYPLLVENHGGPISNYGERFSPELQLFAAAGYVVFYPNPRGSTGYGEEFGNLLYHNYPGEDYNDVMDGVDELIKKGIVSEDSLYVTGGSAGGIMTAWIIGKNNRFNASAVVKPVMNWVSKTLVADNYFYYANSRYPGQPWENFEDYMKFSPLSLVGSIQTPTLVMVGTDDLRTPLSESKQLYHALKLRKIDTALVEIPGASHFIAKRPSQLITKIDHILAWFDKYK